MSSATTWRGGEQQIAYLVKGLEQLGVRSTVLVVRHSAMHQYCKQHDIPHFTYRKISSANLLVSGQIKRLCRTLKVTVLHAHDSHAHTFAYLAVKLLGLKASIVVSRRVDFAINTVSKYDHPSIKAIICVSDAIKSIVVKSIKNGSKAETIHSGVDIAMIKDVEPFDIYTYLNLPTNAIILGQVAALTGHKDQVTLVRSMRHLVYDLDQRNVHLVVVGAEADATNEVYRAVSQSGMQDYITFVGYREDAKAWLKGMDIFVFSSKMEGLGTSVLDAMAAGVPIVSTQAGGLQETVIDGDTALAVPIADHRAMARAVSKLIHDEQLQRRLCTGAAHAVQQYSFVRTAELTYQCYMRIVQRQ